ncbi:MAG: 2Fe-2S iron-sulfur cluster-binding protein [Armatimonadota bacterium]|nr:2Fe-2S iron-sulfur cluster-binding protein [Armatimonadota bacterium]MDR7452530.1 2Fe-2S iron-sulfur cluster-binding protein [Armatimonadota bacterium]MDR7467757.1 2Fe-2S iron-sulfur cluster-binding protein [Armatimonadota bacterium]MDR7494957.1 2Fe-2S iron-sulfur cluster-binding protein [Armatimonadota bacterium]MDR7499778.1 2Fe-2S iron-sulfur cluster-binding protein [Armatimonadota bacterium]
MPRVTINGIELEVEHGTTVLEAARFLGIPIPALCHDDSLTPYGACRLCLVEVGGPPRSRLQSACTLPVSDDLVVRTHSARVDRARRLLLELYVATCPQSKTLQDLASRYGVRRVRLEPEFEDCIQCGKCVRICREQMMAGAIGFAYRGPRRRVMSPFRWQSDLCRQCGACLRVCPVVELRCHGPQPEATLCAGCLNFAPACLAYHDQAMCFLDPCAACELAGPLRPDLVRPESPQETTRT